MKLKRKCETCGEKIGYISYGFSVEDKRDFCSEKCRELKEAKEDE